MQIPFTINLSATDDDTIADALEEIVEGLRARNLTGTNGTITARWPDEEGMRQPGRNPYIREPSALTVHARIEISCVIDGNG